MSNYEQMWTDLDIDLERHNLLLNALSTLSLF